MSDYLNKKLATYNLSIEEFNENNELYKNVKNNLINFSKNGIKDYSDYSEFVYTQISLGKNDIQKNTIALYLSNLKSAAQFYDKNEALIVLFMQRYNIHTKNNLEKNNEFMVYNIAKHTVVGRIISKAGDILSAAAGVTVCAKAGGVVVPKALVVCGAVWGMIGMGAAIYNIFA